MRTCISRRMRPLSLLWPMGSRARLSAGLILACLTMMVPVRPAEAQASAGKIVFESWEAVATPATSHSRIGIMNADGSNAINLTNTAISNFDDWNPSFNRDGSKIVFLSDHTGNDEIYVMSADGTNQTRLTKLSSVKPALAVEGPRFSPDGTKIVFAATPINVPNATWEIYLINADGTGLTRLTTSTPGTGGNLGPVFTPDGTKIVFLASDQATFGFDLGKINLDGSGFTRFASLGGGGASDPSISADGSKIATAVNGNIVLINADGTGQSTLFNTGFSGNPIFSPNGTQLAFETTVNNIDEIFTMNLDGTGLQQVTFGPGISPPSSIEANDTGGWAPGTVGFPSLVSLALTPASVLPGMASSGTVSLSKAAPAGGAIITLASNSASVTLPLSVTIPAGATSATFSIATSDVPALTIATLSATFDGGVQTALLKIDPTLQTDTVTLTQAQYTLSQKQLRVQATSTSLKAVLTVFDAVSGALIGTMTNAGGGKYQLQTTWSPTPQSLFIQSSLGGSAVGAVTLHN